MMERRLQGSAGECDNIMWNEIQKVENVCRFLDGLHDGRTFISLPAECTLEGTRRLLEQINLAKGVRAVAVRLEESEQSLETSKILTSVPRLFFILSDRPGSSGTLAHEDEFFEELLNRLTVTRTFPTSHKTSATTDVTPVQSEPETPDPEVAGKVETDQGGEMAFPSLFNTPSTVNIIKPDTIQLRLFKTVGQLHPEVLPRRAYSVPEALSFPWVHQSIPAWRSTSFPTWTPCTHHAHTQERTSTPADKDFIVDAAMSGAEEPHTPVSTIGDGPMSSCMHSREPSNSDSIVTAATSVHSDMDGDEGGLWIACRGDAAMEGLEANTSLPGSSDSMRTLLPSLPATQEVELRPSPEPPLSSRASEPSSPVYSLNGSQCHVGTVAQTKGLSQTEGTAVPAGMHTGSLLSRKHVFRYRYPEQGVASYRMTPPPCNRHYLLEDGCSLELCPYAHDYMFTDHELERLKTDSKRSPCIALKHGHPCYAGRENCHMGHVCPYGELCRYGLRCKFLCIAGAHDEPPINDHFVRQAQGQTGPFTREFPRQWVTPLSARVSPANTTLRSPLNMSVGRRQEAAMSRCTPPAGLNIRVPSIGSMGLFSPPHLLFPPHAPSGTHTRSSTSAPTILSMKTAQAATKIRGDISSAAVHGLPSALPVLPLDKLVPSQAVKSIKPASAGTKQNNVSPEVPSNGKEVPQKSEHKHQQQLKRPSTPSFRGQKRRFPLRHDTRGSKILAGQT
ncbi:hypothetical protein P389DRAFT_166857 [Cystobasidium minutum MCA 4210]|uniref:uncharacterized protein n=1 Tax=Cystobasidium minutum MCA 4210 TaxID=1397322 RepID=UPI0034CDC7EC|eukprot:jgi/Rhomi1/166857/fgenesh1_kg.2_\